MMKDVIESLETIFQNAIDADETNINTLFIGYDNRPENIPMGSFPYLVIDEDGEFVSAENAGAKTQQRNYQVLFEVGCYRETLKEAMIYAMELSEEIKTILFKEANRLKDGLNWGINIDPIGLDDDDAEGEFRGRKISVVYYELEDQDYQDF